MNFAHEAYQRYLKQLEQVPSDWQAAHSDVYSTLELVALSLESLEIEVTPDLLLGLTSTIILQHSKYYRRPL